MQQLVKYHCQSLCVNTIVHQSISVLNAITTIVAPLQADLFPVLPFSHGAHTIRRLHLHTCLHHPGVYCCFVYSLDCCGVHGTMYHATFTLTSSVCGNKTHRHRHMRAD